MLERKSSLASLTKALHLVSAVIGLIAAIGSLIVAIKGSEE